MIGKIEEIIQNAKLKCRISTIPLVIRRLLISIPALVEMLFVTVVIQSCMDSNGNHLSLTEKTVLFVFLYVIFIVPTNIIWRIMQARKKNMELYLFLSRPQEWTIKHLQESKKILSLLYPNKKTIIPQKYTETIKELKVNLIEKQELAQHYAEIANKTCNEGEFSQQLIIAYLHLNGCNNLKNMVFSPLDIYLPMIYGQSKKKCHSTKINYKEGFLHTK